MVCDAYWLTPIGLSRIASLGYSIQPIDRSVDAAANRWVFKATVYKRSGSKGFVGYGDADPSNVSPLVRGAEMRVAETVLSIALCARPMESVFAQLRSWDLSSAHRAGQDNTRDRIIRRSNGSSNGHPGSATNSAY